MRPAVRGLPVAVPASSAHGPALHPGALRAYILLEVIDTFEDRFGDHAQPRALVRDSR